MDSIKMSYRGFCFNANPKTVKAVMKKETEVTLFPFKHGRCREGAQAPITVEGSGSFFGENARAQAQALLSVFKRRGAAYLFSPVLFPIKAVFTSLEFSLDAPKNRIDYRFSFVQESSEKSGSFDFGYTLAEKGENLFDISSRTGVSIESIIDLNGFETPFSVKEGNRVWLR